MLECDGFGFGLCDFFRSGCLASGSCSGFCILRDRVSVSLQDSAIDSIDAIFVGVAAGGKGYRIEGDAVFCAILCSQVVDLIFLQACICLLYTSRCV